MRHKTNKKWSGISKLLIAATFIFISYSVYAVTSTGTGPLGFIANKLSINAVKCVTQKDEESVCTDSASGKTTVTTYKDGFRSNITTTTTHTDMTAARNDEGPAVKIVVVKEDVIDKGNIVRTTNTIKETKVDKTGKEQIGEAKEVTRTLEFKPGTKNPTDGNVSGLSAQVVKTTVSSKTVDATGATVSQQQPQSVSPTGKSCPGGNGTSLPAGKYAPTGYGWANGARSTEGGTTQRECILINDDCSHGERVACDVVYAANPANVVLPTGAGKEYTGKEDGSYKNNCIDKSGAISVTGSQQGSDRCFDGHWLSETEFDTNMKDTCVNAEYNAITNKCGPPGSGVSTPPAADPAAQAEAAAKALAARELALERVQQRFASLESCNKALLGTSTLECYSLSSGSVSGVYVRSKAPGFVTYLSCPMADGSSSMVDSKKGCGSKDGSVAAIAKANEINPTGKLGGEIADSRSDCRFGGEPYELTKYKCYDYNKKLPPTTSSITTPLTPEKISDNSSEKVYQKGTRCGGKDTSVLFGLAVLGVDCQTKCEGGVYTTVQTGTFGLGKILICGESTDAQVIATANTLSLTESKVQIVRDNSSELTTKKLSACDYDFNSKNSCSRCEVGVVTDVDTSNGTVKFCGSKDDVSNLINSNPALLSPDKDKDSDQYVPYPAYNQPDNGSSQYVPYPAYNQPNENSFNPQDIPGIKESQEKTGAAGSAIGEALWKAGSQIWNTITGIGSSTTDTYEYMTTPIDNTNNPPASTVKGNKEPGEKCSSITHWFGDDNACGSGSCERRDKSANGGREGYFCADNMGYIPSAKVDEVKYTLTECKEGLPSDQECVREILPEGQGVGYFYRAYK